MEEGLDVPVLLITFKRPETTTKVFEAIRKARPKKLFIFSDGPRNEVEKKKVEEVRKIVSKVDWDCEVKTSFQKTNLGMVIGVLGSISWFFDNVEEGIIFDDDCVPTQEFFKFCSEMLEKYRDDERIMHICGSNFQRGWSRDKYSYYFSKHTNAWGWASWRRARNKYDGKMRYYPELIKKKYLVDIFPNILERKYMEKNFNDAYYRNPGAIDVKWTFAVIANNGLSIVPSKNLVRNIGFEETSTNTKPIDSFFSLSPKKLDFPLMHPPGVIHDRKSDWRFMSWILRHKIKKHFLLKSGIYKIFKTLKS